MQLFLLTHLSWFVALHIMAFVSWMAGLFYLPRLFVYHTQMAPNSEEYVRFCLMERRLQRQIMAPAMVVTFFTGALMASLPGVVDWSALWWWVKIVCLFGMFAFHGACAVWRRGFAEGHNHHRERFYRIANEVPTILMIVIVIMIVVRP
ncbi:protoporphyrinogen oxidase HemJ [Bombella sp. ESL0378]|uniref:protoporphyrinogen oxidase HemJ n=1 Tax=Bombella sp. ESL0378 TaxID=2676442 RepID=UPI0012D8EA9D|nr:protoporphyrinogen oxidase HemJ [Bombella sp. ESL0378]MUG05476.1 protoporphyrinogen oxidase HemJ [Bombella sp. ESL0378]